MCGWKKTFDKYIHIQTTKHYRQNFSSFLTFVGTRHREHAVCVFSVQQSHVMFCKSNSEEIATISHFSQSLCSVLTPFLPAFQRERTQFSELYLCNCPEKMGKMGFVLSVFLVFVFGQAQKSSRHPSLSAKVWWGSNTHSPQGEHWVDLVLYSECKSQKKTCWTHTIQGIWLCHSCWQPAEHSDSKLLPFSCPKIALLILHCNAL